MPERNKTIALIVIILGLISLSGGIALASVDGSQDLAPAVSSDDRAGDENEAAESKDGRDDGQDDGDGSLTGATADKAAQAALTATGGGTVLVVESDDDGAGYEVEIRKKDGTDAEVELDKGFNVVERADD